MTVLIFVSWEPPAPRDTERAAAVKKGLKLEVCSLLSASCQQISDPVLPFSPLAPEKSRLTERALCRWQQSSSLVKCWVLYRKRLSHEERDSNLSKMLQKKVARIALLGQQTLCPYKSLWDSRHSVVHICLLKSYWSASLLWWQGNKRKCLQKPLSRVLLPHFKASLCLISLKPSCEPTFPGVRRIFLNRSAHAIPHHSLLWLSIALRCKWHWKP